MKELQFSRKEYDERLKNVRTALAEKKLDAGIFFAAESIFYLTGYGDPSHYGFQLLVVPVSKDPFFATRKQMAAGFLAVSSIDDYVAFPDGADPIKVTCDELKSRGFGSARIGLEEGAAPLTVRTWRGLNAGLPDAKLEDCSEVVDNLRLVKSPAEVEFVRRAAEIADVGMAAAPEAVHAGASEREMMAHILHKMTLAGGEHTAVPLLVGTGERVKLAMPSPTDRKLKSGEALWIEVFGTRSHYAAGLKAIFGAGPASKDAERRLQTAISALDKAIAAAVPGKPASIIPETVQATFKEAGYEDSSYHQSGYSMGVTIAPAPHEARMLSLRTGNKMMLKEGMTLHPIANLYGPDPFPVMAASQMIVITAKGAERLTHYSHSVKNLSL